MNDEHSTKANQPAGQRMLPTQRISYSAIAERAPLKLPNNARMAVWVIVNVEEWDPTQPMPRTVITPPAGGSPRAPTFPTGPGTSTATGSASGASSRCSTSSQSLARWRSTARAIEAFPPIVRAAVERKWEFIGHGFTQRNVQKVPDEREDIRRTREA